LTKTAGCCGDLSLQLTSNQRNWSVFFAAVLLPAGAAVIYLITAGISEESILVVLTLTARLAFLVYLVVFIARPLRQLFATPLTTAVLKNRRLIGVAFAGIHTAHLGFIFYRAEQAPDFEFPVLANLPGALTYGLIYLMFITSFDVTARALGPQAWRRLHRTGLYWIGFIFLATLLPESLDNLADVNWWLVGLTAAAIVIRLTAYYAKRR